MRGAAQPRARRRRAWRRDARLARGKHPAGWAHVVSGVPPLHLRGVRGSRARDVRRPLAHAPGHGDPRRKLQPRDGRLARHRRDAALPRDVRCRRAARDNRRDAGRAGLVGLPRHGQPGAHHLLRRGGDRRAGKRARRARRGAARRRRRHFRQGLLPPGRGRAGVRADGGGAALEARGPLQGDVNARTAIIVSAVLALACFPLFGGKFGVDFVTKTMVFAILALSLELLVGQVGLVCFGQAAFFGIGAYAVVLLTPKASAATVLWLLPAAVFAPASYALVFSALSIRTRGVYFIMVTLAFSQMAYYAAPDTPLGGGTDGIYLNFVPSAGPIDLARAMPVYYVTLACLVAVFVFLPVVMRPRFGRAAAGRAVNSARPPP